MSESLVEYACSEQIATITLNRPDKLNAVNDDMVRQIAAALKRFDTDADAHVAILCGRGRAFSTGADVRQRQMRTREEFERHGGAQAQDASSHDLLLRAVNWKPVMAAVHGYVLGLSLGVTLECDLIVAEAGTQFQVTETPRGLSGAKYWALLNFRGAGAFATDVALTGRFFTAEEAHAAGVIERVAPTGSLMATARALATDVAKNPPLGVRSTIRARRSYLEKLSREVLMQVNLAKLHLTEDFAESARAFAEKRPPRPYKGR
ncbi:MAG: enoyl-CoA hydratase/isomerase family protein [Acetobacteraceae bacterium]